MNKSLLNSRICEFFSSKDMNFAAFCFKNVDGQLRSHLSTVAKGYVLTYSVISIAALVIAVANHWGYVAYSIAFLFLLLSLSSACYPHMVFDQKGRFLKSNETYSVNDMLFIVINHQPAKEKEIDFDRFELNIILNKNKKISVMRCGDYHAVFSAGKQIAKHTGKQLINH